MKKILIATTALIATAGLAQADIAISGVAKAGLIYNSEGEESTRVHNEVLLTFDGTGETDGGLQFGFNTNIIIEDNGGVANDDTTVFLSGAFGKLSFGSVAEADEVAGLSDIGWEGLDVDDVAEALVGDELEDILDVDLSHNVNYTYATGALTFSLSGQLASGGHGADNVDSYAAGIKYSFSDAYVGLGYADHGVGIASADVVSVFAGGTFSGVKVAALYSDASLKDGLGGKADAKAYGLNASYTMDALTLSLGLGKADYDGVTDHTSVGIGAAYDLGGGASVHAGLAQVKSPGDENLEAFPDGAKALADDKEVRADFGVTFTF
ncbi:porin [Pseudorhodobacter turbinis]|uniref:Porin n=1 Tax=Pseudorhodobacter turbinis TaxID=2500533 RepID=A0A4P8EFU7_9RHOB|nr:porin [Pseudorhodobacter turbinis]QCO55687.1 porin [Pseudorhodobacter turbinis]